MNKEEILKALEELRKSKRNFNQTFDLIINLKDFDARKNIINVSVQIPYPAKKCRICAFLEKPSIAFDYVVSRAEFDRLNEKTIKKVVKDYDFCVASAKLMPEIAKKFGRVLGPAGKMPDPKTGCVVMNEDDAMLNKLAMRLKKMTKIRAKEASIKAGIGKENMKDEEISENCVAVYNAIAAALPNKKENIKGVMLKLTMSKPVKLPK